MFLYFTENYLKFEIPFGEEKKYNRACVTCEHVYWHFRDILLSFEFPSWLVQQCCNYVGGEVLKAPCILILSAVCLPFHLGEAYGGASMPHWPHRRRTPLPWIASLGLCRNKGELLGNLSAPLSPPLLVCADGATSLFLYWILGLGVNGC